MSSDTVFCCTGSFEEPSKLVVAEAKIFLGAGFGDELLPFPFLFLRDFLNPDEAPRGSIMEETVEPSLSESESWGGES